MDLRDTVDMMLSVDYKERFQAEAQQLQIRMDKLGATLTKHYEGTLDFKPSCPIQLLEAQHKSMNAYYQLLLARATLEKIDLNLEA